MQRAITFSFQREVPSAQALADVCRRLSGVDVASETRTTEFGRVYTLRFNTMGEVIVELTNHDGRAAIEFDEPPTYLEWVVTAAFQDLGGEPSQCPPPFARKRFQDVTWWDLLQLERRLFPRRTDAKNRRSYSRPA
jgi:hypothetical protein